MRLLVYSLNYAPEPTGTGKYTGEMAAWLAQQGHDVDAIAAPPYYPAWELESCYRGKGLHTEMLQGVWVMRVPLYIPPLESLSARGRILMECSFSLISMRYWIPILLSRRRYDAVIAVCPPMQIGLFPAIYSMLRRIPWVYHIQDLQVDEATRLGMLHSRAFAKMLYRIEAFLLHKATRVSTITDAMRSRIVEKGVVPSRIWLFPNWSDVERITPLAPTTRFRSELGITEETTLVMYAGGMGEKQGLEVVLYAAERLREQQKVRFVLVGRGAARKKLEELATTLHLNNVSFLPVQPVETLATVLAAGDIHLVIQKTNAADLVMPSKLTNIFAAGRPAIATANPGTILYDVLVKYDTGMAVRPEDAAGLARAISDLANNKNKSRQLGDNARKYAEAFLNKEAIIRNFEQQLRSLCC